MADLRCRPGDLCCIIPGPNKVINHTLRFAVGFFVTVTETCPKAPDHWHFTGSEFVLVEGGHQFTLHALPDQNLKPIRPSAPSKTVGTWSPKKQTLLTR